MRQDTELLAGVGVSGGTTEEDIEILEGALSALQTRVGATDGKRAYSRRAGVVIVGVGDSGATADRVLRKGRLTVVGLERVP